MATPTIRTVACNHSINFFGNELDVTVTSSPDVISSWIDNVRNKYNNGRRSYSSDPLVVGVGVQWTPAGYHSIPPQQDFGSYYYTDVPPPPRTYVDPPADTLQLCVGKQCLIIQLSHCTSIPNDLRNFLLDPQTFYVGVWNGQDARKLAQSSHNLEIGELFDIRYHVRDSEGRSLMSCSFETIVQECMGYYGVSLDPETSMSDWSVDRLFDGQVLQASLDVYVCSQLGVWARIWEV